MNRQAKRMQQKMGGNDDPRNKAKLKKQRVGPLQFFREVKIEMSKVGWPTRKEVIVSTVSVSLTIILLTGLVFGYDFAFARLVGYIFN